MGRIPQTGVGPCRRLGVRSDCASDGGPRYFVGRGADGREPARAPECGSRWPGSLALFVVSSGVGGYVGVETGGWRARTACWEPPLTTCEFLPRLKEVARGRRVRRFPDAPAARGSGRPGDPVALVLRCVGRQADVAPHHQARPAPVRLFRKMLRGDGGEAAPIKARALAAAPGPGVGIRRPGST